MGCLSVIRIKSCIRAGALGCSVLWFCGATQSPEVRRQGYEKALKNPNIQAFLDVIAKSEGTEWWMSVLWGGVRSYLVQYPHLQFTGFQEHPHRMVCSNILGKEVCSTAAGRYQFLASTWDRVKKSLQLRDFSPRNQDLAAVFLIDEKNALGDIKRGQFESAVYKLNRVWPSFPGSPYMQPFKKMSSLKKIFEERKLFYSQGGRR